MLTDFFETFKRRTLTQTDSPLGGKIETWVDGATFQAGVSLNNSREAQIAYRNGLATQYIIVVPVSVTLRQNDRVKRVADGVEFRVTSNSADMHTPACAVLQYAQVTAEVIL
jgi:SPP1 family predicted phage head-tail adaptor